ncbi:MAG: 5'-methylthioadenosine/adenosylhomocysteine nucleosidase, partial [Treponema sp.]|nr:5'-methylthioadenosine/adenosylhomocysteine nucleosidase [Treponema sp.]
MIGIIGAMEQEVRHLRDALEGSRTLKAGSLEFHSGLLEGREVTLLKCGVGKTNAAVGCALLIELFKPEAILNTGSAGGVMPGLSFGDLVLSTGLLYHDVDVCAFGYKPGQIPEQPQIFETSKSMLSAAEAAFAELQKEKILPETMHFYEGIIATGDAFMHRTDEIARLRRVFPEVAAVEMEGAAIAHCCALLSVPTLAVRALSDIAGAKSPVSFAEFLPVAAKRSAEMVRRIVRN